MCVRAGKRECAGIHNKINIIILWIAGHSCIMGVERSGQIPRIETQMCLKSELKIIVRNHRKHIEVYRYEWTDAWRCGLTCRKKYDIWWKSGD